MLHDQIFDLMYYGNMGWTYSELYDLPTYLRKYFLLRLVDTRNKEAEEAKKKAKPTSSKRVVS